MVSVMALGIWAILKVKNWRESPGTAIPELSPDEQLDQYQKLVEEGLLDPEELDRIKARLEATASSQLPNADKTVPSPKQPPDTSISEK